MASPAKRTKYSNNKAKSYFASQAKKSNNLNVGDRGFLVTCNFRERDSIREVYALLNSYYKKLNETNVEIKLEKEDDELDVEDQLKKDIAATKKENEVKSHLFNYIDTGVQNLLFIRFTEDPLPLGTAIIRDLYESKVKKTKVTLRFIPVQCVCKAKIEDIVNAAGALFDQHFLKEPSTFAINFNKRYNNDISRDEVIKQLAELVQMKNPLNKVNLKEPQQSIIVEIIKGQCLIGVLPDYLKMKKYNIAELWDRKCLESTATGGDGGEEKKSELEYKDVVIKEEDSLDI